MCVGLSLYQCITKRTIILELHIICRLPGIRLHIDKSYRLGELRRVGLKPRQVCSFRLDSRYHRTKVAYIRQHLTPCQSLVRQAICSCHCKDSAAVGAHTGWHADAVRAAYVPCPSSCMLLYRRSHYRVHVVRTFSVSRCALIYTLSGIYWLNSCRRAVVWALAEDTVVGSLQSCSIAPRSIRSHNMGLQSIWSRGVQAAVCLTSLVRSTF